MGRTLFLILTGASLACLPAPVMVSESTAAAEVEVVAGGLETLWAIAFAPDGRIFLTERAGRIRIIKDGKLQKEPWMVLDAYETGEAGLMGLALDPEFSRNRFVYAAYSYRDPGGALKNRLVRLREDPATARGERERVLVDEVAASNNHNGGRVKFGPDRRLYWTMGDAQYTRFSQDLSSLNGKILRLNPDGTVPADNPFAGSPVYSYGHRNPQGLAWQPGSGRLYSTEHGPSGFLDCCRDEVNLIEAGKNYGWPAIRGDEIQEGMVVPVLHSGSSETWAPGGATFVTRGAWAGSLLFAGLRGQSLYRLVLNPKDPRKVVSFERLFSRRFGRLRDIAEGPDGKIYMLTSNRDGRGRPAPDDDRVLRITVK